MSVPVANRPDMALDLTRWNRAGLSKFDYLDGDAAVWLEEVKLALLGLYMREGDDELRLPEFWRDLFTKDSDQWPSTGQLMEAASLVDWKKLAPKAPPTRELRGQRNARLLDQYSEAPSDLSWEILRAFARASHVLLGHGDAYANEGYLRTATQWDNLRRLAAMVNHQPTPPASATSRIALLLKDDAGAIEIARGLAMKYAPPEGGAPLVFETLEAIDAHPDLNMARVEHWNRNARIIHFSKEDKATEIRWIAPEKAKIAPGNLAILESGQNVHAVAIEEVDHDTENELAAITLDRPISDTQEHYRTYLHVEPDDVLTGLPRAADNELILKIEGSASFSVGQVVKVLHNNTTSFLAIDEADRGLLKFKTTKSISGRVSLIQLAEIRVRSGGRFRTALDIKTMYFARADEVFVSSDVAANTGIGNTTLVGGGSTAVTDKSGKKSFKTVTPTDSSVKIANSFHPVGFRTKFGYVETIQPVSIDLAIKGDSPQVLKGVVAGSKRTVSFSGKPPKGLEAGDMFVMRAVENNALTPLKVDGLRTSAGEYHILFDHDVAVSPDKAEFHGPMTRDLRPENFDYNPDKALTSKTVLLINVCLDAQALLKPGRPVILSRVDVESEPLEDANATITSAVSAGDTSISVTMDFIEDLGHWSKGELALRINSVEISHGESKDGKILGSGDGERNTQVFDFAVSSVSHIPSTIAESGVAPDMDIAVDGIVWAYSDFIDPAAEGTKSWSSALTEDNNLQIYFRRRLPTGTNNVQVRRYRIGTGATGSGIPSYSFKKPMKKSPYVAGIYQPFVTSGGADREAVSSLRQSTPSRLAANGRAVSLTDFERLIAGQASVWRARAEEISTASAERVVLVTLVPANGADLSDTLEKNLRSAVLSRALPGVRLNFARFEPLKLKISATVRADLTSFERTDLTAQCDAALRRTFALEAMDFAQPVYRSEILASLETVFGVETAVVTDFDIWPSHFSIGLAADEPRPKNVALRDGAIAAIYPADNQVAFVPTTGPTGTPLISIEVKDLA